MELSNSAPDVNVGALHATNFVNTHSCATQFRVVDVAIADVAAFSGLASVKKRAKSLISRIDPYRQVCGFENLLYGLVDGVIHKRKFEETGVGSFGFCLVFPSCLFFFLISP